MLRYFLVLAVTAGSLLTASFVLGLMATAEPRGPHDVWHSIHILFALMTTMAALAVHSIVYTYFLATSKWAKEVVRVYQLPEWINTQAKKNKRKAFRFVMWSTTWIAVTAWLGAASDTQGTNPLWHLGVAAVMLAFNVGSFIVEYAVIVTQVRLLADVKNKADSLRAARYGAEAEAETPVEHA
jgi:hypothetical protein